MTVMCSGCKVIMGRKTGDGTLVSHSICRKCWAKLYPGMPVFPEVEAEWRIYEGPDEIKTVV
jgi:hypothetical protein